MCPEPPCIYGGAGTPPMCEHYCGRQYGRLTRRLFEEHPEMGWPELNELLTRTREAELTSFDVDVFRLTG